MLEFYGISNYREPTQTELMEFATVEYLKWAFLKCGGFTTHKYNSPTNMDLLKMESSGIYRARRSNWVYETGLSGTIEPVSISGVYIDGTLSTSGFDIDYNGGRVIFSVPSNTGSEIRVEHSHRTPNIYKIGDWFQQVQFDASPLNPDFNNSSSGIYNILNENRIQLPAVVVHIPTKVVSTGNLDAPKGRGLGSITSYHKQDTLLYVMANSQAECAKIHDILINQKPSTYMGLDKQEIMVQGTYPLDYNGYLRDDAEMYPELVSNTPWQRIDINNTKSIPITSLPNFHIALVTWNTEILIN